MSGTRTCSAATPFTKAQTRRAQRALDPDTEASKRIRLKVAGPCSADWNSMKGDDAVRHCGSCKKSVYQLSNMSSAQVEALLADSKEERCVRFCQRKDGTLLTENCTVGVRRKRRKLAIVGASMSVLSAVGYFAINDILTSP